MQVLCPLTSAARRVKPAYLALSKELPGATHHAYAYRLGMGDNLLARSDDDGGAGR